MPSDDDRARSGGSSHGKDALPLGAGTARRSRRHRSGDHHARTVVSTDWQSGLPVLSGEQVTLRELRASDAPSLFAMLTTEEVARFISPPPTTVEGFERFIAWTLRQRAAGTYACFAVTLQGLRHGDRHLPGARDRAGLRHRRMGLRDRVAVLGHRRVRGRRRAGARVRVRDGRRAPARGARGGPERPRQRRAAKIGAVQEGVLRKSFLRNGEYLDQVLCAILDEDWRFSREMARPIQCCEAPRS